MDRLPASLKIAIWYCGGMWLLAILAYTTDSAREIMIICGTLGLIAAFAEWRAIKK